MSTSALRAHPHQLPRGPVVLVVMDGDRARRGRRGRRGRARRDPDARSAVGARRARRAARARQGGRAAERRRHGQQRGRPQRARRRQGLRAGRQARERRDRDRRAVRGRGRGSAVLERGARGGAVHFLGLLSDGNVHSHLDHLEAMLGAAAKAGCKKLYVHALLDGRDVPPTSALDLRRALERFLAEPPRRRGRRADRVGRRPHDDHDGSLRGRLGDGRARLAHARARRCSACSRSATEAIETLRAEQPGVDRSGPAAVRASPRRRRWPTATRS